METDGLDSNGKNLSMDSSQYLVIPESNKIAM